MKRKPTGLWWNELSTTKRRKVVLTINEVAGENLAESLTGLKWGELDFDARRLIETYREVDAELTYAEKHQGLERASGKHW